ncbi:PAS domain-containing protein, partial [Methylobacterium hispanicum]
MAEPEETCAGKADLRLLRAAVEASGEGILITSAELDEPGPRIEYANPAFTIMTGYAAHEVVGRTPRLLQGPGTERAVLDRM